MHVCVCARVRRNLFSDGQCPRETYDHKSLFSKENNGAR